MMPDGLLIFIHEAVGSCSESPSAGQSRASPSARVCGALLCAAGAHMELPQLFPVHFVSLKNPDFLFSSGR